MFECSICKASESRFVGHVNGKPYCRRCIDFKSQITEKYKPPDNVVLSLDYQLSNAQKDIALKVKEAFINRRNVLINAVCGAGKTELVYEVIKYALDNGMQVGFSVPRKDVVIDLYPRFVSAFPLQKVVSVYGNHTDDLIGNIILLTTHQLYRYEKFFDLLIIDETDAFPFNGNDLLNEMFNRSLRGNYIMMSATVLPSMVEKINKENGVILSLNKRYHNHPLPLPMIKTFYFGKFIYLIYKMRLFMKNKLPLLVFVPTIDECERLYRLCSIFVKNGNFVHSKRDKREAIVSKFKEKEYSYLITTSILERGITLKNIQVIVYDAQNELFDDKTLVQIAGRVGRKVDAYDGEVIFIGEYKSESMVEAVRKINQANK